MGHEIQPRGQIVGKHSRSVQQKAQNDEALVLEKAIFNNVFKKDIRRVYIYKRAERLAKALQLIAPAFDSSQALRSRVDELAVSLVDTALKSTSSVRERLPMELLALSSMLTIARTNTLLSRMNADLIDREVQQLLQEVASYEEPRLAFDDVPTLSALASKAPPAVTSRNEQSKMVAKPKVKSPVSAKGHIKDRRETVLSVIREKGSVGIKDISLLVRDVSEKTIQRELADLVEEGIVAKSGERRWSTYSIK